MSMKPLTEAEQLGRAAETLIGGGVIVYPTETVYGLGALAHHGAAIERIAQLKGSRPEATYLLLIRSMAEADRYARSLPQPARELMQRFWPGPLTLILPARDDLHPRLLGPSGGVGLRVSSHPWCELLLKRVNDALVSTSANFTGQSAPMAIKELDPELAKAADLVVDRGVLTGLASTLLDMCAQPPKILRVGAITPEEIEVLIGKIAVL